jgi:cytochrome c biogenesis protein CcmG/thiol:disulfide interchange protein DsbE
MRRFLLPLILFIALVLFLGIGLRLNPREVPSPFIGKPAPEFKLTQVRESGKTFSPQDFAGQVWLLNVWSSWCVSCREEHPVLVELAKTKAVPVVGLNYKELRGSGDIDMSKVDAATEKKLSLDRAGAWLTSHGDPYTLSVLDLDGRVGIDYGVYGVPETFVIDKHGIVRMKYIGPLTSDIIKDKLLPLVQELNRAA